MKNALRFDLLIAVCALLISTLATGAAWWQARIVAAQTRVLALFEDGLRRAGLPE